MPYYEDGTPIQAGDEVGFKRGVEQSGIVHAVHGDTIVIEVWDGDTGQRNLVQVQRDRVWQD